ncbi:MAG: hydroxymethylbilane synthase [Planctomycetota bacterium]|nr:MAG: hydroxymethylbilane synthase [Planctomycetota bacterium]
MSQMTILRVGSRRSPLAQWQTNYVQRELQKHYPQVQLKVCYIQTRADKNRDKPLHHFSAGAFTKELDWALLQKEIDFAVHSLKDLPTTLPPGLKLAAITKREDARDAFYSPKGLSFAELPRGAVVATGSLRRRAQLLYLRPDLQIVPIRGNVETRIRKVQSSFWDGTILALAGLKRLGFSQKGVEPFSYEEMLPAAGQGSLAVVCREGEEGLCKLLGCVEERGAFLATTGERACLQALGGGCQLPLGVYGKIEGEELILRGVLLDLEGKERVYALVSGKAGGAEELGKRLAKELLRKGGEKIIQSIFEKF